MTEKHQLLLNFNNESIDKINYYRSIVNCSNTAVIVKVLTVFCKDYDDGVDDTFNHIREYINNHNYSDLLQCSNSEFRKKYHQQFLYVYINDNIYKVLKKLYYNQNYADNFMRFVSLIFEFTINTKTMSYLLNFNNIYGLSDNGN